MRKNPKLEDGLAHWIRVVCSKNILISSPIIKEKATTFTSTLGINDFMCSEGWLTRFKASYGLTVQTVSGEAQQLL